MSAEREKCDPVLGAKVRERLLEIGVETPLSKPSLILNNDQKVELIEKNIRDTLTILGLDLNDDSLKETPHRVSSMYVTELYSGLDVNNFPKCTTVENKFGYDEMVVEKNINVMSSCEHHMVGIVGKATVAYIPKHKVLGLSKLNRIVDYFSRRPQVQERLTAQIFHTLQYILETENVAVILDADHYCVKSRGIEDTGSSTVTSKLGGAFKNDAATRAEVMSLARKKE